MIDEIQALLTITIPNIANWRTGGDSSIPNSSYHVARRGAGKDFNPDRDLSLPLKSLSPHRPPGWNDPYRSRKRVGGPLDGRLVVVISKPGRVLEATGV